MKAIILDIDVLYFCCFKKVTSTSLILTYLIPPFTTIRGLLSNILGYKRDDLSLQEKIKIGIMVKDFGFKNKELAKILKLKQAANYLPNPDFPSSPMFREFLVQPEYKIFIGGQGPIIEKLNVGFNDWARPIYLGQSDDLIDLKYSEIYDAKETETNIINSALSSFSENTVIEKVPYRFGLDGKDIDYKILSIPIEEKVELTKTTKVFKISDYFVELI